MKPSLRILNLEDSVRDAELNQAMLSARWPHCEYVRVDSRQDFVSALEEDLDLILSDYTIPNFNGLEALALAHERRPEVPFLFVSGTIGEDAAVEALKSGATDYVLKHRLIRLIPAVDRALREAEAQAECHRAEEAMRQSEYKYRTLFEALGDGAFLVDEKTGKIIDVNDAAISMVGWERGKILGRNQTCFLIFGADSVNSKRASEGILLCSDGNRVPIEIHNTRLTLHGHALVLRLCHQRIPKPHGI